MTSVGPATDLIRLDCALCGLSKQRTQVVPAEGSRHARLVVVGEAPGPEEDEQGRPFVGRAGKILRRELEAAGFSHDDVWITNAVKCFPHQIVEDKRKIRAPTGLESDACRIHLARELQVLRPRLLLALGRTAAQQLLARPVPSLEAVRGQPLRARPDLGGARVFVTYHPSGLHYSTGRIELFRDDLRTARRLVEEADPA